MFLITADVAETMSKILPVQQNLFPVSLKRKLEYEGHYMREAIDKGKLDIWWTHFKKNNPLYADIEFEMDLVDEFCESIRHQCEDNEKPIPQMTIPEDEIEKEIIEEVPLSQQHDTLMQDKYEDDLEDNSVAMQLANNIIQFEIENNIEIEDDKDHSQGDLEYYEDFVEEASPPKKKRMEKSVSVAPGEKGSFKSWNEGLYIEELSFPHLFPQASIIRGSNISYISLLVLQS